jgi:hypothetical protein
MQKTLLSLLIGFFAILQMGYSQAYVVSGIEKTDKDGMQYEILGKVADHYWIYKKNGSISTIAQYDAKMQLIKQNDLSFLPSNIQSLEFIAKAEKVFALYQFQNNKTVYVALATLNAEGLLQGSPVVLDTAQNIRPGSRSKIFNVLHSDDLQKTLLFSVNTSNPASIKVKTTAFDGAFENPVEATISISSPSKKTSLSDFALDNNGNLFCLRNTTQESAAPAVSLICMSAEGKDVIESPIVNNNLLLDDIRLKIDNAKGTVLLNSFYATNKKGHIEGLFTYVWSVQQKAALLSAANRFTDANRAMVSTKRNLKDAFDAYYLDKVNTQADGSFVVMAESAETYSNRSAFSRWDYFWGGPFYNPYIFHYWNRPFGFYPWTRMGWGAYSGFGWGFGFGWGSPFMNPYAGFGYPTVTYNAKQIALLSFDVKGNLQWIKTIDKSQTDINVDQFIGYGSFENADGSVNIIYYDKHKRQRQFVVHSLSANGQLNKGEVISLQEKGFDWMPRGLKQVGEKECIIPYQYNNKIGFAKVQIK